DRVPEVGAESGEIASLVPHDKRRDDARGNLDHGSRHRRLSFRGGHRDGECRKQKYERQPTECHGRFPEQQLTQTNNDTRFTALTNSRKRSFILRYRSVLQDTHSFFKSYSFASKCRRAPRPLIISRTCPL